MAAGTQTPVQPVQAALKAEVPALGGAGIDVQPVDSDGGRAEESLALGVLRRLDPPRGQLGARRELLDQRAQPRHQALVVRAALEVEELDPNRRGAVPATATASGLATLVGAVGDGLLLHALVDPTLDIREAIDSLRALIQAV